MVTETDVNDAAKMSAESVEADTQNIQNTNGKNQNNEADDQQIESNADANSTAATELPTEKEQDEADTTAADTSLTAEDEAHFQMLREAAVSPPRVDTESVRIHLACYRR